MKYLASGFHKNNFRTIDISADLEINSLKITNVKGDFQIQLIIENKIERDRIREYLAKMVKFPE